MNAVAHWAARGSAAISMAQTLYATAILLGLVTLVAIFSIGAQRKRRGRPRPRKGEQPPP